jgi:hypothetical protein
MSSLSSAAHLVSLAIKDVNAQMAEGPELIDSPTTQLLGEDGVISSLSFAFFIVTIEQYALDNLDQEIVLFDDEVMDLDFDAADNPFRTIGSLTELVSRKLS